MRKLVAVFVAVSGAVMAGFVGHRAESRAEFEYARKLEPAFTDRVLTERAFAGDAGRLGDADRWAVMVALLVEMAHSAHGPADRAFALDAALVELTRSESRGLIARASPERVRALGASLARFDTEDPAGFRDETQRLARARLRAIERQVLQRAEPSEELDALLLEVGWTAEGRRGPRGRQPAEDRADFRAFKRHEVGVVDGMVRRHIFLPPTEALQGVPIADLEYALKRSRNFVRRIGDLWVHQDGPRVHDFILDYSMRDGTGIARLVHADTTLLAQHDRLRRWRLREALWRLDRGG